MPKPKKGPRLGGSPAHQRLMLSNLATALFEHGRITTTETRARLLRPVAEKLITKAKRGDLHNRREVLKTVRDKSVVHTLFTEIAPTFAERPGGYTRITKIGPRKGDNAPMAVIELVTEAYSPKAPSTKKTQAAAAPAPAAEETEVVETEAAAEDTETDDQVADGADEDVTDGNASGSTPARTRRWRTSTRLPGLPDQGQRGLEEVPRARRSVVLAGHRGGVARPAESAEAAGSTAPASDRLVPARRRPVTPLGWRAFVRRPGGGGGRSGFRKVEKPPHAPLEAQRRARTSAASRLRARRRWRRGGGWRRPRHSLTGVGTPCRRPWSTTSPAR